MKKIIPMLITILVLLVGCKDDSNILIPAKTDINDTAAATSSVNSSNLDDYMFREDVQYVDLRSSKMVLEEGYVAGFEFIPFYSIIASFNSSKTLYKMKNTTIDETNIAAGQKGSFIAQYEESESIIKSLFSNEKYIFFISQGGSECSYIINLLVQLGYDSSLLYNVGGVSNSEGIASYKSVEKNKYYVSGPGDFNASIGYDFTNDLTPIE